MIFGLSNRGVSFIDAAAPANLSSTAPVIAAAPSLQPSDGPLVGGTSVALAGQNFTSLKQLNFGTQSASNVTASSPTQIQANSPPSATNGAVNVTSYFQNGWLAIAPDAFSYGPQILQILPNVGINSGGDSVQIYGYGFGGDPTKISVKIGGATAVVQKVESAASFAVSLGLDASYPFSLERITLQTPASSSGKADVFVSTPAGSTTSAKSFQYLQSLQSYSNPALYKFLLYDQKRQRLYLTNVDHVDVFDLQQNIYFMQLQPSSGPLPTAALRGAALTPDGSQLVVADFGSQSIYLFDLVAGTATIVPVGGVPGFTNSGPARVAATSTQTVFVGLTGEGGSSGACSTCLAQMNLTASPPTIQPAPQPEVRSITGAPLVQGSAAGDRVFVTFGAVPGGPVAVWNASAPNQFLTSAADASATDLGAASDGGHVRLPVEWHNRNPRRGSFSHFRSRSGRACANTGKHAGARCCSPSFRRVDLSTVSHGCAREPGVRGGIDILDVHSGVLRLRILLPQQFMTDVDGLHGGFLATDENGQRLFAITSADGTRQGATVTVVQLAAVPLGIGTITPSTVSATGGATVTIRGSGFQSATTVTINGKSASVSFKDSNTLLVVTPALAPGPQQITLTNPDGETASLDAAVIAN